MILIDDERIGNRGMSVEPFWQKHVRAEVYGTAPELGEEFAFNFEMTNVFGVLRRSDWGNCLIKSN
jgi:hypothetical protein